MGIALNTREFYELAGGMNDRDADTSLTDSEWSYLRDAEFNRDGSISTRRGCQRINDVAINGNKPFLLDFYYSLDDGTINRLFVVGDKLYRYDAGAFTLLASNLNPIAYWTAVQLSNRVILGNGIDDNIKFNGTQVLSLSILPPIDTVPIFTATVTPGGTLGIGTYQYTYTYRNLVTLDESNPVTDNVNKVVVSATTSAGNQSVVLSGFTPSLDPQVDEIVIYRTELNGTTFYQIATKPNDGLNFLDAGIEDGVFELEEDNDLAPKSGIIATFLQRLYLAVNDTLYYSKPEIPGSVPSDNLFKIGRDGQPITCLLSIGNNALLIGKTRSIWILTDDPSEGALPVNFNNLHGILNQRCASILDDNVFFIDQSIRPYTLNPTELANRERRVTYIGRRLARTFDGISKSGIYHIKVQTVSIEDRKQWYVSLPLETSTYTDSLAVLDWNMPYTQGMKEPGAWSVWTGLPAGTLQVWPDDQAIPRLWRGDYNGFFWLQNVGYGDGASINGLVDSATSTSITDNTLIIPWTVNQFVGMPVFFPDGTGKNQRRIVISNTADTLTFSLPFAVIPDTTTTYSIGGIFFRAYTNWKSLTAHEDIKRFWFLWSNFSKAGKFPITVSLQFDFNTNIDQTFLFQLLIASGSFWGTMIWGIDLWGGLSSVVEKLQFDQYFHHIRIGYLNGYAGQPVILNGMGITFQQKGLFTK